MSTTVDPIKPSDNPQNTDPTSATKQDNLPEKFKGKTAEEIANSYLELEKKHTQTAQEYGLTKKQLADLKALEQFIDNDPESLAFLKQRIQGRKQVPNQQTTQIDTKYDQLNDMVADTRLATQAQIFEKFEGKYGLNEENDSVKELKHKIGETIKQMVAPKSNKTPTELMAGLPLDTLPMYLENAYKLVNADDDKERTRRKALAQARQNMDGTFSSTPSSLIRQNSQTLTAEEKKVAKGLGISEEKYLKQKQAYAAEYQE